MSNVQEKKQATVTELHDKLENAKAFYLTDFTGLTVKKVTELRSADASNRSPSTASHSIIW